MARTAKPKAPAPTETSPKVDGAAAAGADNAPVTPDAPTVPPTEAVPPDDAAQDADAQSEVGADTVGTLVEVLPADMEPLPLFDPRRGFVLRVRALQPVRWRIGRPFTGKAVEIAAEGLTEDQMQALMSDQLLAVDVIAPE